MLKPPPCLRIFSLRRWQWFSSASQISKRRKKNRAFIHYLRFFSLRRDDANIRGLTTIVRICPMEEGDKMSSIPMECDRNQCSFHLAKKLDSKALHQVLSVLNSMD